MVYSRLNAPAIAHQMRWLKVCLILRPILPQINTFSLQIAYNYHIIAKQGVLSALANSHKGTYNALEDWPYLEITAGLGFDQALIIIVDKLHQILL